jgi:diguanylate cyclase (GGDEF)-like protein/PAS domain S-box-containing protein
LLPLIALAFGIGGVPSQAVTAGTVFVLAAVLARQALMQRENRALTRVHEREAQARLALLQAQSDLGEILVTINRNRFASVNEAAAAVTGYTVDELMAMESIVPLIPEEERQSTFDWLGERVRGGDEAAFEETLIIRKDGSLMNLELSAMPLHVEGEMHLLIVGRDVTARREAEAQARLRDAEIAAILESIPDMVTRLRRDGTFTFFKPPHGSELALDADGMLGRTMRDVMPPAFADAAIATIERTLDTGEPQSFEFVTRGADSARHFEGIMSVCDDDEVVAVMRDITLRKQAEQALREAVDALNESKGQLEQKSQLLEAALNAEREHARRDSLTGALNHGAITEMLQELIETTHDARAAAVIMVDVNGMKATNDTYGHQVGDNVLVKVAETLARDGAVVGRYGGDEFVAVLPGADRAMAEAYRDSVISVTGETRILDPESGARVPLNVSIGIAVYPEEAESVADLIRLSDEAMYAVKRERPINEGGFESIRPLADERAARMVGELVPLLTSPGDLQDKLRLVGHKLSIGAGYDGVNIVFTQQGRSLRDANAFARVPQELLEAWNEAQRNTDETHPATEILERTRRPIILHDLHHDEGLTDNERVMLTSMGLQSALIAPMLWQGTLVGALSVGSRRADAFGPPDAAFLMGVATQVTAIVQLAGLVDDLQAASERLADSQAETVMMLAAAAEAHDRTTGMHLQSIRALAEAIARELGYDERAVADLGLAAVLHDIGKVSVSDSVLGTPGKLAPEEWEQMKAHTIWGGEFLSGRPGFALAASVARSHHERWDGAGYPDGLRGEQIPEAAAIVTVADSFDAMTHDRPYKSRLSVAQAIEELRVCTGTQFSPRVVEALLAIHERGELPGHDGAGGQRLAA